MSSSQSNSKNPLKGAVEILEDRLYFCALKTPPTSHKLLLRNPRSSSSTTNGNKSSSDNETTAKKSSTSSSKIPVRCFCIDQELIYWNFYLDFGPLNLGQLYRFTVILNKMLQESKTAILFYSSTEPAKRANAIYLITAWQVLELKRTPEQAYYAFSQAANQSSKSNSNSNRKRHCSQPPIQPLTSIGRDTIAPLPPFHDASPVECTYDLSIMDCLAGLVKARQFDFFDWDTFNVEEYEYFEQVENGDLNWIVKDRIMAFAGPSYKKTVSPEGYCTLAPADYIPYFKSKNVSLVVRLNQKNYHEEDFIKAGISHLDQFYLDGSCPPMKILQRVLTSFEAVPKDKAFAVHCKAGLGRTGTCIGAYLMKQYRITAPEVISWMRICRPGCVIGPQQQFLQDLEPIMWQEGEMMRVQPSLKAISPNTESPTKENQKGKSKQQQQQQEPSNEKASGRPGQAEGLLARRQRTTPASRVTTPKRDRTTPVPVTPDSVSSTTQGTSTTATSSSSTSPTWIMSST